MDEREKILLWRALLRIIWSLEKLPGQRPEDSGGFCGELIAEIGRLERAAERKR